MNNTRSGFTLVELIVVIAILGILACIAIPVYSGYISKAHEAADLQNLDVVKTAAVFTYNEERAHEDGELGEVTKIDVGEDSCVVTATLKDDTSDTETLTENASFLMQVGQTGSFVFDFESNATSATWQNGAWTFN